jgi:hypothetical protein
MLRLSGAGAFAGARLMMELMEQRAIGHILNYK